MNPTRSAAALFVAMLAFSTLRADDGDAIAVTSRISSDYVRTKQSDGSYPIESYAFGNGGYVETAMSDPTIEKTTFTNIAHIVAPPLRRQNFVPAQDPAGTRLLIMVYWGTTAGSNDSKNELNAHSLDEKMMLKPFRDRADVTNAKMLGYDAAGILGTDYGRGLMMSALHHKADELLEEIGENRYFVVLMAYDFQLLWKEKKAKLLWETRFSLQEHHNDFGEALPVMAHYASKYFGQDSHGLLRKPLRDGRVELGELKSLETTP